MTPFASVAGASALRHSARRTVRALLVFGLLASGCGKKTATGPPPEEHVPPSVVEAYPAARATRVPPDTTLWVRFREPLDSTTVASTTVFLKVDTRRVPVMVTLEDSARTIVIRPLRGLELRRTHTIELSPRIRTAAGTSFDETYFWQFTTLSVRRPANPEPAAGATFESPVTPLFWDASNAAGPIEYRLFYGADSTQVETEATNPVLPGVAYHLPTSAWERGATVFWKVRVRNLETGDEMVGPVWRFEVVPPGITPEAMLLPMRDSGYWDDQSRVWRCPGLVSGARATGIVRFNLASLDSSLVVADALILLFTTTNVTNFHFPVVYALVNDQGPCDERFQGFPLVPNTPLATGALDDGYRMRFNSVSLATHVQARIRGHEELYDYALRSARNISYNQADPGSGLLIFYFRPAAAAGSMRR